MARLLRLTSPYLTGARQLGVRPRTELSRDVSGILRALQNAGDLELPGPGDLTTFRPPRDSAQLHQAIYGRRVPGRHLWVWYRVTKNHVEIIALSSTPTLPR